MRIVAATCLILLAYTWFAYPLAIGLLSRLRSRRDLPPSAPRPQHPPPADAPPVSVVVATRGSDEDIRARVQNLLDADYPSECVEVIVACDATRPGPAFGPDRAWGARVKAVAGDEPGGKAATLNAGVRAAAGEILVFTDTAQRFDRDTIRALVAGLAADPRLGAVSGALHLTPKADGREAAGLYWRFERWLRRNEACLHSAVGVTGAVWAMRRGLWQPLPAGLILDDLHTPMRLVLTGHRIGFVEEAIAHDARLFTAAEEARRRARTLTGVLQLTAWLPAVLSPRRNPIWLQFVSHKLLRLLTPYLLAVVLLAGLMEVAGVVAPVMLARFAAGAVLVAAVILLASSSLRRLAAGVVFMMGAVMRAWLNAARGEWDVWQS